MPSSANGSAIFPGRAGHDRAQEITRAAPAICPISVGMAQSHGSDAPLVRAIFDAKLRPKVVSVHLSHT